MRVVLTGSSGRVGSAVLEELTATGNEVRCVGREWATAELGDRPRTLLAGADAVVHCAGVQEGTADQLCYVNNQCTARLIEQAAELGVRTVALLSSCAVLSSRAAESPYAMSKLAGEYSVARVAREHGCRLLIVRSGWVLKRLDRRTFEQIAPVHGMQACIAGLSVGMVEVRDLARLVGLNLGTTTTMAALTDWATNAEILRELVGLWPIRPRIVQVPNNRLRLIETTLKILPIPELTNDIKGCRTQLGTWSRWQPLLRELVSHYVSESM